MEKSKFPPEGEYGSRRSNVTNKVWGGKAFGWIDAADPALEELLKRTKPTTTWGLMESPERVGRDLYPPAKDKA